MLQIHTHTHKIAFFFYDSFAAMFEILHIKLFYMTPLTYFFKVLIIFAVLLMTLAHAYSITHWML